METHITLRPLMPYYTLSGECMLWMLTPKNPRPELPKRIHYALIEKGGSLERNVGRYVFFTLNPKISRRYAVIRTCGNNRCVSPNHLAIGAWNPPDYRVDMEAYIQYYNEALEK